MKISEYLIHQSKYPKKTFRKALLKNIICFFLRNGKKNYKNEWQTTILAWNVAFFLKIFKSLKFQREEEKVYKKMSTWWKGKGGKEMGKYILKNDIIKERER